MSTHSLALLSQRSILKMAENTANVLPTGKIAKIDLSSRLEKMTLKALVLSMSIRYSIAQEPAAPMQSIHGRIQKHVGDF